MTDIKDVCVEFTGKQGILELLEKVDLSELEEAAANSLRESVATRLNVTRRKPEGVATALMLAFTTLLAQYRDISLEVVHKLVGRLIDAFIDNKAYTKEFAEEAKRWYNDRIN